MNVFDHAVVVNHLVPEEQKVLLRKVTSRVIVVGFQPTSENLVVYIASILQPLLPSGVTLYSIRLYETETSFAEWFAADN